MGRASKCITELQDKQSNIKLKTHRSPITHSISSFFPQINGTHDKLFKRLRLALIHNTPIALYIYKAFSIVYFLTRMKFIWVSNLDYIFLSYSCSYLSRPVAIQIQQMLKLKLADAQSNTVNIIIFPTNQLSPQRTRQTLELINKTDTYLVQT